MMFRCFAFAAFATLAASPAAQADPADDLRWYNDQPVTLVELALRDLTQWMSNELDASGGIYGETFAYMDEEDGPIVLSLSPLPRRSTLNDCDLHLRQMREVLFSGVSNQEQIIFTYSTIFVGHSAVIDRLPESFAQSISELTVLEVDMIDGSCRMPLLGGPVTHLPNDHYEMD